MAQIILLPIFWWIARGGERSWWGLPLAALAVVLTTIACGGGGSVDFSAVGAAAGEFSLTSQAFEDGGRIPTRYTCDGVDRSPPIGWSNPPEGTQSYVLIVEDPDAPGGTFTHWIILEIPSDRTALPEGIPASERTLTGLVQLRNDFKRHSYGGPCPSSGAPHRYRFLLYALDDSPALSPRASKSDVLSAVESHMLARAELTGTYER